MAAVGDRRGAGQQRQPRPGLRRARPRPRSVAAGDGYAARRPAPNRSGRGRGPDEIGLDGGNRFLIGLEHGLEEFGLEPPVMRIEMDNEIPLARGLARRPQRALPDCWPPRRWPARKSARATARAGDRYRGPPGQCLGRAAGRLRGRRRQRPARFDPPPTLYAALFIPDTPLRTAEMRAALPETVSHADATHNVGRTALIVAALASGTRLDLLARDERRPAPRAIPRAALPAAPRAGARPQETPARWARRCPAPARRSSPCPTTRRRRRHAAEPWPAAAAGLDLPGRTQVVRPSTAAAHVAETVPA